MPFPESTLLLLALDTSTTETSIEIYKGIVILLFFQIYKEPIFLQGLRFFCPINEIGQQVASILVGVILEYD